MICSGCEAWKLIQGTDQRENLGKGSQNNDKENEPKKKRQRKAMNKKMQKMLQNLLESINTSALVVKAVAGIKEHSFWICFTADIFSSVNTG